MNKGYYCINEPDDRCIDCSPNCPNSETFGQPEPVPVQDLVELELCLKKGGLK